MCAPRPFLIVATLFLVVSQLHSQVPNGGKSGNTKNGQIPQKQKQAQKQETEPPLRINIESDVPDLRNLDTDAALNGFRSLFMASSPTAAERNAVEANVKACFTRTERIVRNTAILVHDSTSACQALHEDASNQKTALRKQIAADRQALYDEITEVARQGTTFRIVTPHSLFPVDEQVIYIENCSRTPPLGEIYSPAASGKRGDGRWYVWIMRVPKPSEYGTLSVGYMTQPSKGKIDLPILIAHECGHILAKLHGRDNGTMSVRMENSARRIRRLDTNTRFSEIPRF
jgi:hypothetical protein